MHHCDDDAPRHIGAVSDPLMSPQRRRYLAFHAGAAQSQGFTHRGCIETKGAAGAKTTVVVRTGKKRPVGA